MKKLCLMGCLIVIFCAVLSLKTMVNREKSVNGEQNLSQSTASDPEIECVNNDTEAAAKDESTSEKTNDSYPVHLEVDGGYLRLRMPSGYQLQEYRLSDLEKYPYDYIFLNEATQAKFVVKSSLKDEKNQGIWLRKLYDKSNKFMVFDDVLIGEYSYIVYVSEQGTYEYGFLVREGNGYSYQFYYQLPYDIVRDEIPAEAISVLSTLEIQESSEDVD